jgi:alpha-galactosidase
MLLMLRPLAILIFTSLTPILLCGVMKADDVQLSSLDLSKIQQGFGKPQVDKSVEGNPLRIGGIWFAHGVGTHAASLWAIDLKGKANHFHAMVGIDDDIQNNPEACVRFVVSGDGKQLWESGLLKASQQPVAVDLDVSGVKILSLQVKPGFSTIRYDHADWADATLTGTSSVGSIDATPNMFAEILTPPSPPEPNVHGPLVFGVRPDSPVLYTIPATGAQPMTFAVLGLPSGLSLDANTGQISGSIAKAGHYPLMLQAINSLGEGQRALDLIVGDAIALTPPLGWNSWNCWGPQVTAEEIRSSAKAMISSGLAQHGWCYINIDDTWQGKRGGDHNSIQPNDKFPDMKGLVDTIHGLGLRAGIYSTPWKTSYAGYIGGSSESEDGAWTPSEARSTGKRVFAIEDAQQWAAWGVDYLKYDWRPIDVPEVKRMSDALRSQNRDIVFSLSNSADFEHAADYAVLANLWRTTDDIQDNWDSIADIGFSQDRWAPYAGPGHYNDADMLVVGVTGGYEGASPHATGLTPDEQYTHISLWALLSAPLLIGCDLDRLDKFTLGLLTNDEVLEIDQDIAVNQAVSVYSEGNLKVYRKILQDGSMAVGMFNCGPANATIAARWPCLGIYGRHVVRDVWREKDLGTFDNEFAASVASHGVLLLRIAAPK